MKISLLITNVLPTQMNSFLLIRIISWQTKRLGKLYIPLSYSNCDIKNMFKHNIYTFG